MIILNPHLTDDLRSNGLGRRKLDDEMFKDDQVPPRLGIYDEDEEDMLHSIVTTSCPIPSCVYVAQSLLDFESHYNSNHRYACSICKKNQPSAHLLDLHIQENHCSFFAVMSAKKPSYCCYTEECHEKFQDAKSRLEHCIQVHKLPKDFRFDYKPKQKKKKSQNKMDIDDGIVKKPIILNNAKRAFIKRPIKKFTSDEKGGASVDIDEVMLDLEQSLPK